MERIAALTEERAILEQARAEAERLFAASSTRLLGPERAPGDSPRVRGSSLLVPLAARGRAVGVLELERSGPFAPEDAVRAAALAGVVGGAVENARLLLEAGVREAERARLTDQIITAEQDERRRLSLFLHDGPLQQMSGIALMHEAALQAIAEGRHEDAARVVRASVERERDTIRLLRDLTFAIEPVVLRDHGLRAAVQALGEQIEQTHRITVSAAVGDGERMSEKVQVALYQIIREALTQAVRRRPERISVSLAELADGTFEAAVSDDGHEERRRASIEAIEERVSVLNGRLSVASGAAGGTTVRVTVPAYVAGPLASPSDA